MSAAIYNCFIPHKDGERAMVDYNFKNSKRRYYSKYDRLETVYANISSTNAENSELLKETFQSPPACVRSVLCALSIATMIIIGSAWQLYYALENAPISQKITQTKKLSPARLSITNSDLAIKDKKNLKQNHVNVLIFKNAIAKGKF